MNGKPKLKETTLLKLARLYMLGVYGLVPLPLILQYVMDVSDTFINGYYFPVMAIFLSQGGQVFTYLFGGGKRTQDNGREN